MSFGALITPLDTRRTALGAFRSDPRCRARSTRQPMPRSRRHVTTPWNRSRASGRRSARFQAVRMGRTSDVRRLSAAQALLPRPIQVMSMSKLISYGPPRRSILPQRGPSARRNSRLSGRDARYSSAKLAERKMVRSRGIEPPRAMPTAPSTLRVYQFRHDRGFARCQSSKQAHHVANPLEARQSARNNGLEISRRRPSVSAFPLPKPRSVRLARSPRLLRSVHYWREIATSSSSCVSSSITAPRPMRSNLMHRAWRSCQARP